MTRRKSVVKLKVPWILYLNELLLKYDNLVRKSQDYVCVKENSISIQNTLVVTVNKANNPFYLDMDR